LSDRLKVLVVHNRYRSSSPSGEDRVVDQEAAALRAENHGVELFERRSDEIAERGVVGKALVAGQVVWSEQSRKLLRRHICRFRPDVVHVHNTFPLLSPSVLSAAQAEGVPVVATVHNYRLLCPSGDLFRRGAVCDDCVGRLPVPALQHRCYRGSLAATLPLATSVVAHRRTWRRAVSAFLFLSCAQRDRFRPYDLPPERVFVKPNFVPATSVVPAETDDLVVFAARLTAAKGVHLLMDAWDRFQAMKPGSLRLVVAGSGPLEHEVAEWAISRPSVEFRGILSHAECLSLLGRARASLMPSLWEETFGLVAVEAMASGVAPVAAAHGSFPEIITDGIDGVLFEPGNARALASVLCDIADRPERYRELGLAARATHARRFSPGAVIDQLVSIYRYAIAHPARSG